MKLNFKLRCLKDFLQDSQYFVNYRRFNISNTFTYRIIFQNLEVINYNNTIQNLFNKVSLNKNI